jgi:hypothetical protein
MILMIENLKEYIIKNGLETKAIGNFWTAFKNWKYDNPDEYLKKFSNINPEDLHVFIHSVGLRASEWPECNYFHVTINVKIFHEGRELGNYSNWFSLSTNVENDDFLEI